jgi:DNA-binding NarL/FixJ family response regulator
VQNVNPTRGLLADDHALVRADIRALIDKLEGVDVIAKAGDGREALRLIENLRPDIVLLDTTTPGFSGFAVLEESRRRFPNVRVIILTLHASVDYAIRALRAGSAGFLPKSAVNFARQLRQLRVANSMSRTKSQGRPCSAMLKEDKTRYWKGLTPQQENPDSEWELVLVHRLIARGDTTLLPALFKMVPRADGAMAEAISGSRSHA